VILRNVFHFCFAISTKDGHWAASSEHRTLNFAIASPVQLNSINTKKSKSN